MTATILLGLVGCVVLGLVLVGLGWRGKRLNDHPICRSCSFDLHGTLPEGITCPECGAGLKRLKAYRVGARRKRWVVIAAGAVLVLLPMATIGTVGFGVLTGKDFNSFKPTGVLIWEGKHLGAGTSKLAAEELERRTLAPDADAGVVATIVAAALHIQGDAKRPWNTTWGDIITNAMASGTLSEEDTKRYYDQGIVVEFEVRLRVAAGGTVPVILKAIEGRVGGGSMLMGMVFLDDCTLDGQEIEQVRPSGFPAFANTDANVQLGWIQVYGATMARGWGTGTMVTGQGVAVLDVPEDIAPGQHQLHVVMAINTIDQSQMGTMGYTWPEGPGEDHRMVEATFEIEVVPVGVSTVEQVAATTGMTERLEDALSIGSITVYGGGIMSSASGNMIVTFTEPPEALACEVYVKQGSREWRFGSLTTGTLASDDMAYGYWNQQDGSTVTVSGAMPGIKTGTVDVILRPSDEVAQSTIDITRYYGGELVFHDVDVEIYGGSSGFLSSLFEHFARLQKEKAARKEEAEEASGEAESPGANDEGG